MDVPKKILVDMGEERNLYPAGYLSDSDDYDDDYEYQPKMRHEPVATVKSPPEKLTLPLITEEERTRYQRDTSIITQDSGDDALARQIKHLHKRLRLMEEDISVLQKRQALLIGAFSLFIIYKSFKFVGRFH